MLEITVGIQAISLTDGIFSVIITTALHTFSLMSSPAMALHHFPYTSVGYYHANLKEMKEEKRKQYISVNWDIKWEAGEL